MAFSRVKPTPPAASLERQRIEVLANALRRWENTSQVRYSNSVVPVSFDNGLSIPSRIECCLVEATENPILYALKVEAREIGWSLYMRGGTALMRRSLDGQPPKLNAYLAKSWLGVGNWGGAGIPAPFRVAA